MPGASEESEFAIDCNDILEAFLHDMSALDRHQQKPKKCGPVTTVSTAPVVQIPKTVKKRRLNPSWLKRKRDLEALRAQSEALETRKEFLLRKRSKLQGGCSSETVEQQEQQRETLALEKHKCEGALGENAYLKGKLQAYVNLSGALQTVFTAAEQQKQQLMTMSMAVARALRTESGAGYQLRLGSPSVFDLLEERVNRRFRELEASFVTNKLAMTSADTEFVQVYYANAGRRLGTVEFKRAQLLPFDETIISTTILSIIEVGGFPDDQDTRVVKRSSDVFAMDSRLTVYLDDGGSVNLNNHSVMKRFLTPTGIVLMLESISDWTADLQDSGSWTHTTDEGGL
ncbi:uncharacterized protein IUM83_01301 [Phytophthora cinnamomi]|uniref:uncharacterized protein n=1 Tax=Phytophthora cinnamomi TaxID=4785 RepID=UPI003559C644|nr:hypothetical protein IUM83_01301 [Phytophthora cinnamomi]